MKRCFTLAEVLVVLVTIGVVATITIPTLIKNYQEREYETAQKVLMTNLRNATRSMQVEDKLSGYKTTADFIQEFKNYFKIIKICDSDNLQECFSSEFLNSEGDKLKIDKVKKSSDLNKNYTDNNIGIITANGTSAIVTYNPDCKVSGMNFQDDNSFSCLGMMYDLNGFKKPNKTSVDVKFLNANLKSCSGIKVNGLCYVEGASTFNNAPSYCENLGMRIATQSEMEQLFPRYGECANSGSSITGATTSLKNCYFSYNKNGGYDLPVICPDGCMSYVSGYARDCTGAWHESACGYAKDRLSLKIMCVQE